MNDALKYLVAVALFLPLAVYVWAAMSTPRSKVSTLAGYFTAYHEVGAAPFANSSLAYAFQVATLFPFLYWGVGGQILPAVVNAVCWGIGIFLFRAALNPIMRCLDGSKNPKTLHGLLAETYPTDAVQERVQVNSSWLRRCWKAYASKPVQMTAAGVTILGMLGVALGEAYWGMQIVKVLVPEDTPAYYAVVLGALFFVLAYIWYGGAWGSMKTDMLQLVFSYIGFTVVFLFAIWTILNTNVASRPEFAIVSLLMFAGGVWAVGIRLCKRLQPISAMSKDTEGEKVLRARKVLSTVTLVSMCVLALLFAILFVRSLPAFTLAPLANPGDPKWKGIIALALMATLFQFVDMTAWQRMQAIDGTEIEVKERARRGLLLFSVESPYSWILCLALGTLLVATVPQLATAQDKAGPLAAYPRILLESGGIFSAVVAFAFMVAVMGVMLSTIDSALLGAMYAWVADFFGAEFKKPEASTSAADTKMENAALLSGKKTAFWVLVVIMVLVILLGWLLKRPQDFIVVLVGFYGAMLSLFPAVMFMLFAPKTWSAPSSKAVTLGIIVGTCGAIVFAAWGVFVPNQSDKSWDGVFAGPGFALAATGILWLVGMRRKRS
ncbi:MAG: hypothetical protein HY043_09290 [Verrucomicrobia bacterium]|nr:hypothetical protein [Verrucomicrobiota bacterium]